MTHPHPKCKPQFTTARTFCARAAPLALGMVLLTSLVPAWAQADTAYQAALQLQKGEGVKADPAAAAAEFQRLADTGHAEAGCRYAEALVHGTGIARNFKAANPYAEKAAQAGIPSCMVLWGDAHQMGRGGMKKDGATALDWYIRAGNAGFAEGMYEAGEALRTGQGVPSDIPRAVEWLQKAVAAGSTQAMAGLGFLYAKNNDHFIRRDEGVRLLRTAAQANNRGAQIWLGEMLAFGSEGVSPDPVEGQKWLQAAATAKLNRAYMGLARIYRDGLGTPADWQQALRWADLARENNDNAGAGFIGRMYMQGGPKLDKNRQLAFNYLKHAYGAGDRQALADLQRLLPYKDSSELLAIADTTTSHLVRTAFSGLKINITDGLFGRQIDVGRSRINLQLALQTNGDMHMTLQASNIDLLKTYYKAYVLDQLHTLDNHDAWLYIRTQILD